MSLRARLTVVVAAIVALAVAGGAWAAWAATSHQLHGEVDRFLLGRVDTYVHTGPGDRQLGGERDHGGAALVDFDAITKVLDANGDVYAAVAGQPALPVDATDRTLAADRSGRTRFRDVTVGGQHYRLLTVSLSGGGAVQLARSLSETDDILHVLRDRLLLAALGGAAIAALVAWEVARRTTRPVVELTAAAEAVAATQDLSVPIPVRGDDEVGRLASSFNAMLAALGTSRDQQRRLVTDASHELRTPLTAVRTNVDLLLRAAEDLDVDQRRELLDETRLELDELTALVAELVELATDARADEPVVAVDLAEVAEDVAARFRRRSGRAVTVASDQPAEVEGRRAMLDRAVANLVDNALKFSPSSEPVEVHVTGRRVTVLDRGPGVHGDDRTRVFDRFYRADATRTMPGSGLGLAIVKQVAQVHGGSASIDAREGGGAVATLDLG
jgi:two-component system sensor histidine kinase MprB